MTVTNHTDIATYAAANAATFNAPLGQLDAAIGDLTALTSDVKTSLIAAINSILDGCTLSGALAGTAATFTGQVQAGTFVGNGAALTGITGATGGIANIDSTTIGSDTDSSGVGTLALQTQGVDRITISPTGTINVIGQMTATQSVAPAAGAGSAYYVVANCYNGAGSQWAAGFNKVNTVAGQSTVGELDGLLTALYHSAGFTVPNWTGVEGGGCFVSGAGSVVTTAWGIDSTLPTCSAGGTVGTAAAYHIGAVATTGITTAYAIYSELSATSQFAGPIKVIGATDMPLEFARTSVGSGVLRGTCCNDAATNGTLVQLRFGRGTYAAPAAVLDGDILGAVNGYGYIDGDYRQVGGIQLRAAAAPGAGSYPGAMYVRLVANGGTALATRLIVESDGTLTVGTVAKEGAGSQCAIYSRYLGVGRDGALTGSADIIQAAAAGAKPVMYLQQVDVDQDMIEFDCTLGVGNAIEAIALKTLTTTHFIKVTITGEGTRYIPCGTIA